MRFRVALLAAGLALPLMAQGPAPSSETLALAKQLVGMTGGERDATLAGMSGPMVGMMQQLGMTDPLKAREMVDEAVMPLLREHYDELIAMQARSYAAALTAEDLKATIAFYNTKAGQDLIHAQPMLAQSRVTSMTQWIGTLQPEMQARIQKIAKVHGWDKS